MTPKKLVLIVIDAMVPAMLEAAVAAGRAPALAAILERGRFVRDCVAPFPSVTPVCAATITTGAGPDGHAIPAMNWWHAAESRYVEYGSSFTASRRHGVVRSLTDTVYRMNGEHLSGDVRTVFERLDDDGWATAGTTYLIYRGRHRHEVAEEGALGRIVTSTVFRDPVLGPRELFYADLFASRRTGCRSQLGMPGIRDQHTGCVGAYLAEHRLYDFLLFSLPDNDAFSHRHGPAAQVESIAAADSQIARLMAAAGGPEAFFDTHAVIVCSDHGQVPVKAAVPLLEALSEFVVAPAARRRTARTGSAAGAVPEIAVCPSMRAAQVYVLDADRRERIRDRVISVLSDVPGVDLLMWRDPAGGPGGCVIRAASGAELRFAPGSAVRDERGSGWDLDGDLAVLGARVEDGILRSPDYPLGLVRVAAALAGPNAGDVLASAGTGQEFADWGGQHHIGGGSHGSLAAADSHASLVLCGLDGPAEAVVARPGPWMLADLTPLICHHFDRGPKPGGELARG